MTKTHELTELIQEEILNANGVISFARFMELALYTPKLGYYESPKPKFGADGDFITAPLIHPLFAKSIARQCNQIFGTLSGGDILEVGAGGGQLARDLLLELEKTLALPAHYYIFEKSESLRLKQQELLKKDCPHLFHKIQWVEVLPQQMKGIILANEVLDAMPFHCFGIGKDEVVERCVTFENNQFTWKTTAPTTQELARKIELIQSECPLALGYESELNLNLDAFVQSLSDSLEEGVMLFFDYGYGRREYYSPERMTGTLMCFYQHQAHSDPFKHIGSQDITAHVDFTAVIESGISAHLSLGGFTTQSAFLLSCGLLDIADHSGLSSVEQYKQNQAVKKLTFPSQMGELIKVMALNKNFKAPLLGFTLSDRRRSL